MVCDGRQTPKSIIGNIEAISLSLLIYRFTSCVKVEMPICSHRSLNGFVILHSKLLENILNVLCLANEGALLELLDLKSKEILQLPHHGHLKFLYHNPIKPFTG
jgi:hypothetical protein